MKRRIVLLSFLAFATNACHSFVSPVQHISQEKRFSFHGLEERCSSDESSPSFDETETADALSTRTPNPTARKEQLQSVVLAKTKETFKLAELYHLEASLQSSIRGRSDVEQLGIDPGTGSCFLSLDKDLFPTSKSKLLNDGVVHLPSVIHRFDWLAQPLAYGQTAEDLIKHIVDKDGLKHELIQVASDTGVKCAFTLDYINFGERLGLGNFGKGSRKDESHSNQKEQRTISLKRRHTAKTLSCCVSQVIQIPASLYSHDESLRLVLIECPSGIYLARMYSKVDMDLSLASTSLDHLKRWSSRPFQYSSAMNPTVACVVTDLIYDFILSVKRKQSFEEGDGLPNRPIKLVDPVCGSGTFLSFALNHGMDVYGYDVNPKCIDGTLENLTSVCGEEIVKERCTLEACDMSHLQEKTPLSCFDCAIANLPWGLNTAINHEDTNLNIVANVRQMLRLGSPFAIITKDISYATSIENINLQTIGIASIPQRGFSLPKTKKSKKIDGTSTKRSQTSDCVVIFALAV